MGNSNDMILKRLLVILTFSFTISCNNWNPKTVGSINKQTINSDTVIATKEITDDFPGGAYRKRAKSYFLVINNDTSCFKPIFSEVKEGGKINIYFNLLYFKKNPTYRQILSELRKILPIAEKEFKIDSLNSLSMGRLILNGDIAINLTNEYRKQFGQTDSIVSYDLIENFLMKSQLTDDFNALFKSKSVFVNAYYPEHIWFTTRWELYTLGSLELDSVSAPAKIFDFIAWIGFKKSINKNYP